MSFGAILGQMLQDGLAGRGGRLNDSLQNLGARSGTPAGTSGDLLGQLQTMISGANAPGGIGTQAKDFLTRGQVGGMSGGALGGIGALAGVLMGGGAKGAVRGGALAMLGTLALTALRQAQANRAAGGAADPAQIAGAEIEATLSPETEQLMIRAMIAAAKADGAVDQTEMQKIIGRIGEGGVEPHERDFVMAELAAPLDVAAIVAAVRTPEEAAQVYAASLMAISVDSEAERAYLRDLAQRLNLAPEAVAELHQMTGAPVA